MFTCAYPLLEGGLKTHVIITLQLCMSGEEVELLPSGAVAGLVNGEVTGESVTDEEEMTMEMFKTCTDPGMCMWW